MQDKTLKSISQKLKSIWKKVYIVWWWCRESLLNHDYLWDIDLATNATPDEMYKVLNVIKEVWKKYWTLIIKEENDVFEITTFRKDIWSINNRKPIKVEFSDNYILDSERRDFSCNAIYFDIENDKFIDPQNWIEDIKNNILRFVWDSQKRIDEDALRILRFIRLKNTYNFKSYDKNYFKIFKKNIKLLENISIERIKDEFDKMLLLKENIKALKDLKKIWFFEIFLPDIEKLSKTPGWPKYHLEWNVWIHTLLSIKNLNNIFKKWFIIYDKNVKKITKFYDEQIKKDLIWTMLLHDIWKNDTFSFDENKNVHYFEHQIVWAIKAKDILKKFKFSNNSAKIINYLIENHLYWLNVMNLKKLKARKLMMWKYYEYLLLIWICDYLWKKPSDKKLVKDVKIFYKDFLKILKKKKFLSGNDILKAHPELVWNQIKTRLEDRNNEILLLD